METQQEVRKGGGAKDFFINLGAFVSLYVLVGSVFSLLFTVINKAYPQINSGYGYHYGSSSASISWPVATLIIFFPIFILLMWLLEREYQKYPEKQSAGVHKWLTYITLFAAGATVAGDLITVLYYFIDGRELTAAFLLKVLVVLVIAAAVFVYYISDAAGRLTARSRKLWRVVATVIVISSIVWGFAVLGSPRTQQLYKYDEQKINDLQNLDAQVNNYFYSHKKLPDTLAEIAEGNYYVPFLDPQTQKPYEYKKTSANTYELCADFNKASDENSSISYRYYGTYNISWNHTEGYTCFKRTLNLDSSDTSLVPVVKPVPPVY